MNNPKKKMVVMTPERRFNLLMSQARLVGPKQGNVTIRKLVLRENVQARAQYDIVCAALLSAIHRLEHCPDEGAEGREEFIEEAEANYRRCLIELDKALRWSMKPPPQKPKIVRPGGPTDG